MKHFVKLLSAVLLAVMFSVSCMRETNPVSRKGQPVSLGFDFGIEDALTKSILTDGNLEYKLSNVLVILYRSETGVLDRTYVCDKENNSVMLLTGIEYDIFFLANIDNPSALRVPLRESELEELSYVIPSYETVDKLGVPSCATLRSVRVSQDGKTNVTLRRLMAKVTVHISHSGLTGLPSNDKSVFSNVKLYVRNANARLMPFCPEGSAPQSKSDIMEQSDYDPRMDAEGQTFVFYVPENRQGQLLPHNLDPSKKNESELRPKGIDVSQLTYIEYTGHLNPSVAGYGGDLLYRFYLGADNVGDFNVDRNEAYNISLNLSDDNLFNPYWKVSHGENWQDNRCLRLLASDGKVLGDNAVLAVRPSHDAVINLFMNTDGSASNMASSSVLGAYGSDGSAGVLALAWSSNVWSSDKQSLELPRTMNSEGLKVVFDPSKARLTVSAENPAALEEGKEYELEFFLVPGRGSHTRKLRIKVLPECTLEDLPGQIYVAQKLLPKVSGAVGNYKAKVASGKDYVDVSAGDGLSVIGKKEGTAYIELTSDDQVNDEDLGFSVAVGGIRYFGIDGDWMLVTCDGVRGDVPFTLVSKNDYHNKLDIKEFVPEYLDKYFPVKVSFTSTSGVEGCEDFYDFDPYTLTARVKTLNANGMNIVDIIREEKSELVVCLDFADKRSLTVYLDARPPFLEDMYQVGKCTLRALKENLSQDVWNFMYDCSLDPENLSWHYSGKMKPVFSSADGTTVRWSMTFSRQTELDHISDDVGTQSVWPSFRNIVSGETQEGPRLDFQIIRKY